ncbi:MAG TPA: hypothetical protein PKV36_14275, partial [Leptospiraceae bacterium]|nr:hypothetical protein [Leptospiraceae bacterium]
FHIQSISKSVNKNPLPKIDNIFLSILLIHFNLVIGILLQPGSFKKRDFEIAMNGKSSTHRKL